MPLSGDAYCDIGGQGDMDTVCLFHEQLRAVVMSSCSIMRCRRQC